MAFPVTETMKRWYFASVLSLCSLLMLACRDESVAVSRNDAIRYYLNQGEYEQAIALLKERLKEDPKDDKAKVLLASAYSGSVGINTIDCFEVLRPKLFDEPLGQKSSIRRSRASLQLEGLGRHALKMSEGESPVEETPEARQQRAIRTMEKELLKFAIQSSDALEIAFRLPHVPIANRDRILLSLSILAEVKQDSDQYLTAQLYQGILGIVQFMNYFRDAIPPTVKNQAESQAWYKAVYCQLDLAILLPNLSQSAEYLSGAFINLVNAGRESKNPTYSNLNLGKTQLQALNRLYQREQDLFEFVDLSIRSSRDSICEE